MEVFLYNSTVCRLCGEENDSGTFLYSAEENTQSLCEIINTYLPIKVSDDGQLPRTICPGCTIQLEASVEFLNLIINGQKAIRELHQREIEYKKTVLKSEDSQENVIADLIVYDINSNDGIYTEDHPISLQISGLSRPKRKRGRPPKKPKSPEEIAKETVANDKKENEIVASTSSQEPDKEEVPGKRRRKTPTRYSGAVQGKELERIFIEEGVIEGEESETESKPRSGGAEARPVPAKEPEVIGHLETSGELVVVVKGKGRGRPRGRMRPTRSECAICGAEFSCSGRYMSHIAQHGPVKYHCTCGDVFDTRLEFTQHQDKTDHQGHTVVPCDKTTEDAKVKQEEAPKPVEKDPLLIPQELVADELPITSLPVTPVPITSLPMTSLPDLTDRVKEDTTEQFINSLVTDKAEVTVIADDDEPSSVLEQDLKKDDNIPEVSENTEDSTKAVSPKGKAKLKCPHCDKTFSTKQSKSMHIKAVHFGEKPYSCSECGVRFAYPRSLALHNISHRRQKAAGERRYACDLCGKVLNHPSSVVYHKEAEHAGQKYVCNKCGKSFKHKQLLQRHQLVHSQLRPFTCKTCNSSFKTKANLLNHQLLHSGIKKFTCEICKHKFAHKTSLTLHMRWHSGSKPFVCKMCGKSFSQKGNLSEHERIHTGEKPYQCTLCARRFTTSSQFRLHSRRHQLERPYACNNCPKRFVSRGGWAAHVQKEKNKCETDGGDEMRRSKQVKRRLAQTAGTAANGGPKTAGTAATARGSANGAPAKTYACPHCNRVFNDPSNLNKHKKQVHKQISLLVSEKSAPQAKRIEVHTQETGAEDDERVIYVTYDIDDAEPAYHILDPEQAASLEDSSCSLYSGPSILVAQPELEPLQLRQPVTDRHRNDHHDGDDHHVIVSEDLDLADTIQIGPDEHIAVTDEQGNPLHFTMQDGTRLAITSSDGKSLQVVTHDGQTIPVEINGFNVEEEEVEEEETIQLNQISYQAKGIVEGNDGSPVTHYFTIV